MLNTIHIYYVYVHEHEAIHNAKKAALSKEIGNRTPIPKSRIVLSKLLQFQVLDQRYLGLPGSEVGATLPSNPKKK